MNDKEILEILKKHLLLFTYSGEATETGEVVQMVKTAGLSSGQPDFELLKDWFNENCWKPNI